MLAPTHGQRGNAAKMKDELTKDKKGQLLTHGIVHAGFRGMREFVACKKSTVYTDKGIASHSRMTHKMLNIKKTFS